MAAHLVRSLGKYAAGSGISEIKCILAGFVMKGYLGFATFFIKSITLVSVKTPFIVLYLKETASGNCIWAVGGQRRAVGTCCMLYWIPRCRIIHEVFTQSRCKTPNHHHKPYLRLSKVKCERLLRQPVQLEWRWLSVRLLGAFYFPSRRVYVLFPYLSFADGVCRR